MSPIDIRASHRIKSPNLANKTWHLQSRVLDMAARTPLNSHEISTMLHTVHPSVATQPHFGHCLTPCRLDRVHSVNSVNPVQCPPTETTNRIANHKSLAPA